MCMIAMFIRPTELAIFYSNSGVSKINNFESLVNIGTFFDSNRLGEVADNETEDTLMPGRTRRRGSGQSSVPSSPQSSIRRRTSVHTSRAEFAPLRRSARLLELLTPNELQPLEADQQNFRNTTNGFLAASLNLAAVPEQSNSSVRDEGIEDLASAETPATAQRDNQRACSNHEEAAGMSCPPVNDAAARSGSHHILTILVEPPSQIRPGLLLNPPLVVRLERGSDPNDGQPMPVDPALFWAVVSVVPADSDNPLPAAQVGILTGTPVDSVHPLNPDATGREIGYMSFTDLAIREAGRYRLRINLIQMNAMGYSNVPPFEGGVSVQNMLSKLITVDPDVEPATIGSEDWELLASLQQRGLRVDNGTNEL